MSGTADYDIVVIGGGFFGCCLALYLRSVSDRILVVDEQPDLLTRASRVNQARVHSGFHYPRSFVTALRSRELSNRFARDFHDAVVDDFQMLYAIARRRSKVTMARFQRMFVDMKAPIAAARASDLSLFNPDLIEGAFVCDEFAFDWTVLRKALKQRLSAHGIEIRLGRTVEQVRFREDESVVMLDQGASVSGRIVFNVTYAGLNRLLRNSSLELLPLKHELAEIALVRPPPELNGKAITVMDGPFFSLMPYPSASLYSFTHVRYTPHLSWVDNVNSREGHEAAEPLPATRWRHMMLDAQRYMPCADSIEYRQSLFDVKTVLMRNENDDGRPILLHRHDAAREFYSVLGGKIDNIYDLFNFIPDLNPAFRLANDRCLFGNQ